MTGTEMRAAVFKGLRQIAPEANLEALSPTENVREALDIDSFDFLNFLIGLHETVGIEIPESDYDQLTTLAAMERYMMDHATART